MARIVTGSGLDGAPASAVQANAASTASDVGAAAFGSLGRALGLLIARIVNHL
jgi:hypothetical protein